MAWTPYPGVSAMGLAGRVQVLMDELHGRRPFPHPGGHSLHGPVADMAGGEDPRATRFQPERLALEGPALRVRPLAVGSRQIRARQDEAVTVSLHDAFEPLGVGHRADEDEQRVGGQALFRPRGGVENGDRFELFLSVDLDHGGAYADAEA